MVPDVIRDILDPQLCDVPVCPAVLDLINSKILLFCEKDDR